VNVGHALLDILVVLIAAKTAAELAERLGVPAVVGEMSPVC
jgi:Kef-type K+ transport system membrane component KefB